MNQNIKQRWIAALRSGEYKQGDGYLAEFQDGSYHYCCLGVLYEIAVADGVINSSLSPMDDYDGNYGSSKSHSYLPDEVIDWAELRSNNPWIANSSNTLAGFNDSGASFEEIANIIERDL